MSYDIQLIDGDFLFGPDGNPAMVRDTAKLAQAISKIILTPIGTDPGNAQYGTKLRYVLGRSMDFTIIQGLVAETVVQAITFYKSLQTVQATEQDMTFLEQSGSLDAISVIQTANSGVQVQFAVTSVAGLRQVYAMQLSGNFNT